jgi:hypothetical protein
MGPTETALAAINAIGPEEKVVYTRFATQFGVDCRTLARRHQHQSTSRELKVNNRLAIHPQAEQKLLNISINSPNEDYHLLDL